MRTFLKILLGLVVLIVAFLFWALETVDYTPYFHTDYYETTLSRFDSISSKLKVANGAVQVGFGKQSITPILNGTVDDPSTGKFIEMPLAGFGGREGAPATGIHDSLFVKTVAVKVGEEVIVFVGSDLLIMPPEVSQKAGEYLSGKLGLKRGNIFYSATHTHSSVGAFSAGTVGELFGGVYNPNVIDWLSSRVSSSIEDAMNDLKPGQVGVGNFYALDFVRNRLVGEDGNINSDFMILKASQKEGKNVILGSFDAHATTLGDWNMETSGDYPGYWQRKLELSGFDMAVFFAGSVGSHSYRNTIGDRFEKSQYLGEALADSVMKYAKAIPLKDSIDLLSMTLKVELPEFHIRVSDGIRLNPYISNKLFPDVGDVFLQTTRLDKLIWGTAPSDFSGETTLVYKNAMGKKGFKAMVSSFNGAYTGYIIPCKYYHLNEYESRLMNWFGPAYNPFINYMLGEMMDEVSSNH